MKVIRYHIRLLQPLLATGLEGDPNSAVSLVYVPGSLLRGALLGNYKRQHRLGTPRMNAEITDPNGSARRLFFSSETRFLNGYPLIGNTDEDKKRGLPVPQSWHQKKAEAAEKGGEGALIHDLAVEASENSAGGNADPQWQRVRTPFWSRPQLTAAYLHNPARQIAVHTARSRRYGRAMPDDGAVYRYEALLESQDFEAYILCADEKDALLLLSLLKDNVTLGGSRTGGYGRARLTAVSTEEDAEGKITEISEGKTWCETGELPEVRSDDRLVVTFLSDCLLRDDDLLSESYGQYSVSPQVVAAALGLVPKPSIVLSNALGPIFIQEQATGGFNKKWGLPLPQTQAIKMGCVYIFDTTAGNFLQDKNETEIDSERLAALQWEGIGERRNEGFGRIALNWLDQKTWKQSVNESDALIPASILLTGTAANMARQMARRMLRTQVESCILETANSLGGAIKKPRKSQLARLRLAVRSARTRTPEEGRRELHAYLNSLMVRQITRKQFQADRIAGQELLEWLQERIDDQSISATEGIWNLLNINRFPAIGNIGAEPSAEEAYQANMLLLDAVLARSAKLKRKEEESQ